MLTAAKAKAFLENVPEKYAFYLRDGRKLLNLRQLAAALADMEYYVWQHHVGAGRNDFHNWIRDIVLDLELAQRILTARSSSEAEAIVKQRIAELERAIKPKKLKKRSARGKERRYAKS